MSSWDEFSATVERLSPELSIILGSGQNGALNEMRPVDAVLFTECPGLSAPTTAGHTGRIVAGRLRGKAILVFQGRLHFYEGHSWEAVGAPVRLAAQLGIKTLLLTNAAGGIHPELVPGSIMIIGEHLNWQRPGSCPSFMSGRASSYSPRLIALLQQAGHDIGDELLSGVYAAVTGPCYETPAEIRALRSCGADAVGMSTAYEVETARALGIECAALSGVTNKAAGLAQGPLHHGEVLENADRLCNRLGPLLGAFVERL